MKLFTNFSCHHLIAHTNNDNDNDNDDNNFFFFFFLVCLRGSRVKRRAAFDYNNCDIEIAAAEGAIDIV